MLETILAMLGLAICALILGAFWGSDRFGSRTRNSELAVRFLRGALWLIADCPFFPVGAVSGVFHAAALSSLSAPRATILIASSGNGRCSALASSHGARIQTSRSSSVIRMTGMAFG